LSSLAAWLLPCLCYFSLSEFPQRSLFSWVPRNRCS